MIAGLRATGELSYNGVDFDGATKITVSSQHVRDEANQTTIYMKYLITAVAVFQDNGGTDNDLMTVRSLLAEDGKRLVFRQKGFGDDLVVAPGGPRSDVRMGPKPQVLEWRPIGASRACEVVWTVETCVAECESVHRRIGVSAFNYQIDFDVDEHGDTTRATSGYIEIVQTRLPSRKLSDSADKYREILAHGIPLGFKRSQSFSLSADKSRLDFSFTDTQIPSNNPYPKKVTDIKASHRLSLSRNRAYFTERRNIITCEMTLKAGVAGTQSWLIFLSLLRQRIRAIKQTAGQQIFYDALEAEEDIFSRRCSFMLAFTYLKPYRELIGDCGLWRPLTDFKWREWAEDTREVRGVRGNKGMFHNPATDLIIDLCGSVPTASLYIETEPRPPTSSTESLFKNDLPDPESSYLKYRAYTIPHRDRPVIRQSTLQPPESDYGAKMAFDLQGRVTSPVNPFDYGPKAQVADVLQVRGAGQYGVRLVGSAVRAGYPIPRPALVQANGRALEELSSHFPQVQVGNYFGVPVYRAQWEIAYALSSSPGPVILAPNIGSAT